MELEKAIDATKHRILGIELADESGWTVIDAFDVMIHLFLKEQRERYGLERLWRDATEIPVDKLLEKYIVRSSKSKSTPRKKAPVRSKKK